MPLGELPDDRKASDPLAEDLDAVPLPKEHGTPAVLGTVQLAGDVGTGAEHERDEHHLRRASQNVRQAARAGDAARRRGSRRMQEGDGHILAPQTGEGARHQAVSRRAPPLGPVPHQRERDTPSRWMALGEGRGESAGVPEPVDERSGEGEAPEARRRGEGLGAGDALGAAVHQMYRGDRDVGDPLRGKGGGGVRNTGDPGEGATRSPVKACRTRTGPSVASPRASASARGSSTPDLTAARALPYPATTSPRACGRAGTTSTISAPSHPSGRIMYANHSAG